nr:protein FAR1-RELATED SEQUENCE 5-like [Quercus suber]
MDTSQIILLEAELNDCIADQQEEAQIEPTHASPKNSNTPSRHSKKIVEVLEIVLEDEFIGWIADQQEETKVERTLGSPNKSNTPAIGMKFDCDESAYEFYNEYAHRIGFSVQKHFVKRGNMVQIIRRTFSCSKEGERGVDKRRENASYRRPISRIGCLAQMTCHLQKDAMLHVVSFHDQRNHEFAPSPMKNMLRLKRKISYAQKAIANDAERSGISIKQTIELLSMQVGDRENLGFMDVDYKNHVHNERRMALRKGDGPSMMEYFRGIYDHPFAPFVGVNHHKQLIIFGTALLYDETIESFKWLFETFLTAMSGKQPRTILTDQSATMAKAITKHFANDFSDCLYEYEDEDEWLVS